MRRTTTVIYLWAADDATATATFADLAARCEQYAFRHCWEIVETVRDVGGSNRYFDPRARVDAFGRPGLDKVLTLLKERRAVIVLVPDSRMIGCTAQVYDAVRERVEKCSCFLLVVSDTPQNAESRSDRQLPSVTSENANAAAPGLDPDKAKQSMTQTPKARIFALANSAGFSDSFGALLHMTALLVSDPKTLVPKTDEERSAWGGHLDGLRAALLCLARHEQECASEVAAETVGSFLNQARTILQDTAPGYGGARA